jgi:hypothetical protein
MPSDERSQELATEQPVSDCTEHNIERQERMRQLAYVLFDIFIAQSKASVLDGGA